MVRHPPPLQQRVRARFEALSETHRKTCRMLVNGHSTMEIAARLNLSLSALQQHRDHILRHMSARSVLDLTRMARHLPPCPAQAD